MKGKGFLKVKRPPIWKSSMSVSRWARTGGTGNMKRLFILVVIVLLFAGCAKRGEYVHFMANDNFEVNLIFEVDGVKVYRFKDAGHYHYFAVRNTSAMLESVHTNGKVTYFDGTIPEAVE
jgi:hypothetical protein